jgi:SAM-dependent methyltransferase
VSRISAAFRSQDSFSLGISSPRRGSLRTDHGTPEPPGAAADRVWRPRPDRVLDVGCGTGNLSYALPEAANVSAVTGIDQAEVFLEYARKRSNDPRFSFQHADARALPFADGSFDRAFSMLVLSFIPDVEHAVAEMRRVVRCGGRVTAAVWDAFGGMPVFRLLYDTAVVLDPTAERPSAFPPLSALDEMSAMWRQVGLTEVEQTSLTIRMDFLAF